MYGIRLDIRPTGGLTFRRMPSAILHISSYPFLPPTTMSGWLRRLLMLSATEAPSYPETDVKKPPYFAMPPDYYVLGAYPYPIPPQRQLPKAHVTRRHGPMFQAKHTVFSRLYRDKREEGNNEKLQLHTWEYMLIERLRGYVLHEEATPLQALRGLVNYGCKVGKEGYAFLEAASEVQQLTLVEQEEMPATLLPAETMIGQPGTLFTLYHYQYKARLLPAGNLSHEEPSHIEGFVPFWAGWSEEKLRLRYWTDGEAFIPVAWKEALYG